MPRSRLRLRHPRAESQPDPLCPGCERTSVPSSATAACRAGRGRSTGPRALGRERQAGRTATFPSGHFAAARLGPVTPQGAAEDWSPTLLSAGRRRRADHSVAHCGRARAQMCHGPARVRARRPVRGPREGRAAGEGLHTWRAVAAAAGPAPHRALPRRPRPEQWSTDAHTRRPHRRRPSRGPAGMPAGWGSRPHRDPGGWTGARGGHRPRSPHHTRHVSSRARFQAADCIFRKSPRSSSPSPRPACSAPSSRRRPDLPDPARGLLKHLPLASRTACWARPEDKVLPPRPPGAGNRATPRPGP